MATHEHAPIVPPANNLSPRLGGERTHDKQQNHNYVLKYRDEWGGRNSVVYPYTQEGLEQALFDRLGTEANGGEEIELVEQQTTSVIDERRVL